MTASPFFLNCRPMTVSSGSDSMPSNWSVAGANCQERMPAADDRLVSVVGVEMQSAPRKDEGENVPSGSDPLAVLTANADCEINFVHYAEPVFAMRAVNF